MAKKKRDDHDLLKGLSKKSTDVDVATLKHHPDNPRIGDVDAIAASIEANGWFGTLVVQKSTRFILVGNHSFDAAVGLGFTELPVQFIDCDDDRALRVMLASNRSADLAEYNDEQLDKLLAGLDTLDGTLFDIEIDPDAGDAPIVTRDAAVGATPKYPIAAVFGEKHEYVVIITAGGNDWSELKAFLGLKQTKSYGNTRAVRIGRVIRCADFLRRCQEQQGNS
jgi:hypothetical protein